MTGDEVQLGDVHLSLRHLLKNRCRGERRARRQADLVEDLRLGGHARARIRRRVGDADAIEVPLDGRAIFYLVRDLRLAGCPVMGSSGGMFWAETFEEFVRAKANYTGRFREMGHVARAFERMERSWRARRTRAVAAAPPALRQESLLADGQGGPIRDDARGGPAPEGHAVPGVGGVPPPLAPAGGPLCRKPPAQACLPAVGQGVMFPTASGGRD